MYDSLLTLWLNIENCFDIEFKSLKTKPDYLYYINLLFSLLPFLKNR